MVSALSEGFNFVAMGRALLREPDLVNQMRDDPAKRSRCNHNNKCMLTVFGLTHCVLDPDQRYGDVAATEYLIADHARLVPVEGVN